MTDQRFDRHEDHIIVPSTRKLAFAVGSFSIGISENLIMNFGMIFYTLILKLDPVTIGLALFAPRIWDAISDPVMGQISDRTHSRWGRRRPYILFGAPVFAFLTFLMFAPPQFLSEKGLYVFIFIVAFLYYTAYTVVFVPYTALGAELSIDYDERTRVQTWRSVLMFSANLVTPWTWRLVQLDMFPNERTGSIWVAGTSALLVLVPLWLCCSATREEGELQSQTGLPLWQALKLTCSNKSFVFLAIAYCLLLMGLMGGFGVGYYVSIFYVFGGVANEQASKVMALGGTLIAPAGVVGCICWGWLGTRIGKKEGFLISLLAIAVVAPLSWFLYTPALCYLQLISSVLLGFCFGALGVFPNAMTADICDVDELKSGCRREGVYFGVMSFAAKVGVSGTLLMTGVLLNLAGFDQKIDVQAPETLFKLRLFLAIIPTVVMLVIAVFIWFYPLSEERIREVRKVLEQHRAERLQPACDAGRG